MPACSCPYPVRRLRHELRAALAQLLEVLRADGVGALDPASETAVAQELARFDAHMRDVWGLADNTRFDVILYYLYPSQAEHFDVEMNVLTCHVRSISTEGKHKLDMRQALRTCIYSRERLPMTEEKRRALALEKAAEQAAKKKAKLEKRKAAKQAKP